MKAAKCSIKCTYYLTNKKKSNPFHTLLQNWNNIRKHSICNNQNMINSFEQYEEAIKYITHCITYVVIRWFP
jgi:hypothetical protein